MLTIAFADNYEHPLPEGHRFPMEKYGLLPRQLTYDGTATEDNFFVPSPADVEDILRVHDRAYWQRLRALQLSKSEQRRSGFPLSKALVDREITIAGGSIQNLYYAKSYGCSLNIAGGTHHAYTNRAEGFCLLNDIAISAAHGLNKGIIKKVLVVDLDVHQGNGTAEIFARTPEVFTFSMHGEKNYPLHKEVSDLDIALPDNTNDETYLSMLYETLTKLRKKVDPDVIYFQAGVDVLATDKLGRLGLSIEGCRQRDEIVLEYAYKHSIPVAVSMGGGYSKHLTDIVNAHANTFREARKIFF